MGGGPATVLRDAGNLDGSESAGFVVTMDRLSRKSVARLTDAYTALLGDRVSVDEPQRTETVRVRREISAIWAEWTRQGRPEDLASFAENLEPELARTLNGLTRTVQAIDLLELTPREVAHARASLFAKVVPQDIGGRTLGDAWFPMGGGSLAMRGR